MKRNFRVGSAQNVKATKKQNTTSFNEGDYILNMLQRSSEYFLTFNRGLNTAETHAQQHQRWLDETTQILIQQRLEADFNDAALLTQWITSDNIRLGALLYSSTSVGFPAGSRRDAVQRWFLL
ncbi:hypothetical protein OH492_13310 [Vibrio chagasii]|nr:hypothetical protein [Vibrio chagasii]